MRNNFYSIIRRYISDLGSFYIQVLLPYFPSHHIRVWGLKLAGMRIGKGTKIMRGFHIRNPKGIVIGERVSIGPKVLLDGRKGLFIEDNVTIAYEAIIWTLHHDYNSPTFDAIGSSVHIGKNSWICSRSIILPGVNIGNNTVIASGAVVTKDVDNQMIMGGVPAKKIGIREEREYCPKRCITHF